MVLSFQEELSVLLTDVHQYKRNLDEHFSKLINNKSRIAVSVMCQGRPCPTQPLEQPLLLGLPSSPPLLLLPLPWDSRQGLSSTLFPEVHVLHETQGLNIDLFSGRVT